MNNNIIFENEFGILMEDTVVLNHEKKTISYNLNNISMASFKQVSNPINFFVIFGYGVFFISLIIPRLSELPSILTLIFRALGILGLLVGISNRKANMHTLITINAIDADTNKIKVELAKTKIGKDFFVALSIQMNKIGNNNISY